eukprot:TRINITY_DN121124_c0_g1_i1.p1 TRINITY_DN121124_c0_g1~~TRINITY_DN121124_c0_g1_i1.p1  ORF type:complete len:362 (+),score=118.82 TRINITY_DN121124_c0_g1_i1:152-1237(+)
MASRRWTGLLGCAWLVVGIVAVLHAGCTWSDLPLLFAVRSALPLASPSRAHGGLRIGSTERRGRQLRVARAAATEATASQVEEAIRAGGGVVLDVYASWCGPCKLLEPSLDALADRLSSGDFIEDDLPPPVVLRMNSDEFPKKASEFSVEGLPTVMFFKGGVEVTRVEGLLPRSELWSQTANALKLPQLVEEDVVVDAMDLSTPVRFPGLAELWMKMQEEPVLLLGVVSSSGRWKSESVALENTLESFVKQIGESHGEGVLVGTIDVQANPDVAEQLQLEDLPGLVFFETGEIVAQLTGEEAATITPQELAQALLELEEEYGGEDEEGEFEDDIEFEDEGEEEDEDEQEDKKTQKKKGATL